MPVCTAILPTCASANARPEGVILQPVSGNDSSVAGPAAATLGLAAPTCVSTNSSSAHEEARQKRQKRLSGANSSMKPHYRSFQVQKSLGNGGFGSVFRVKDRSTGALMALKIVLLEESVTHDTFKEVAEKAKEEVLIIQKLEHPNIVLYIDCTYARIPG